MKDKKNEWYNGKRYLIEFDALTNSEIMEFWKILRYVQKKYGEAYWGFKKNALIISDIVHKDIEFHLYMEHFLAEIEERLDKVNYKFLDEAEIKLIDKMPKYDEIGF